MEKNEIIKIRISSEEKEKVRQKSKENGNTISDHIRNLLFKNNDVPTKKLDVTTINDIANLIELFEISITIEDFLYSIKKTHRKSIDNLKVILK